MKEMNCGMGNSIAHTEWKGKIGGSEWTLVVGRPKNEAYEGKASQYNY